MDKTIDSLDDLVYATKVPSKRTKSGYEVTYDPDYLKQAILELFQKNRGCIDCKKLRCEDCERLWQT